MIIQVLINKSKLLDAILDIIKKTNINYSLNETGL